MATAEFKFGAFVRPRGSSSLLAIGIIQGFQKEDGATILIAKAPKDETLTGETKDFEVVERPVVEIGRYLGIRKVECVVSVVMNNHARFDVVYRRVNTESADIFLMDIPDPDIAKQAARTHLRIMRHRFDQTPIRVDRGSAAEADTAIRRGHSAGQ